MIRAIYNDVTYETETVDEMLALLGRNDTASNDDWIEWSGGKCPVDPYSTVEVKLRDGGGGGGKAYSFAWNYAGHPSDIVAYRVVKS